MSINKGIICAMLSIVCGNLRDDASDFGETRGIVMAGVVVYFPCSLEGRAELAKCVATIHAQMVLDICVISHIVNAF